MGLIRRIFSDKEDPTTGSVTEQIKRTLDFKRRETPSGIVRNYWRILQLAPEFVGVDGGHSAYRFVLPFPRAGTATRLHYVRMWPSACANEKPESGDHGEINVVNSNGAVIVPLWSASTLMRAHRLGRWIEFAPNGVPTIPHTASMGDLVFLWKDACSGAAMNARMELWIEVSELLA